MSDSVKWAWSSKNKTFSTFQVFQVRTDKFIRVDEGVLTYKFSRCGRYWCDGESQHGLVTRCDRDNKVEYVTDKAHSEPPGLGCCQHLQHKGDFHLLKCLKNQISKCHRERLKYSRVIVLDSFKGYFLINFV